MIYVKISTYVVLTVLLYYFSIMWYVRNNYQNRHRLPCGVSLVEKAQMAAWCGSLWLWGLFVLCVNLTVFIPGMIFLPEGYNNFLYLAVPGSSIVFGKVASVLSTRRRRRLIQEKTDTDYFISGNQTPPPQGSIFARVWDIYREGIGSAQRIWEERVLEEHYRIGPGIAQRIKDGGLDGKEDALLIDIIQLISRQNCWSNADLITREQLATADVRQGIELAKKGLGAGARMILWHIRVNGSEKNMHRLLREYELIQK